MSHAETEARWTFERIGGLVGVAAAVLILVSAVLGGGTPNEPTSTDQELLDFYLDSGNQFRLYVSAFVGLVAGLLFLWFLVALHNRLQAADKTGAPSFVFAAGIVFVTFALVGGAIGAAVPASLVYDDSIELTDLDTLRVVLILGNHWLPGAAASTAAVVVGVTSFLARRHRLYKSWLAWAGLVVGVLMLPSMLAFAGFTLIGLMVWTAGTGVWLARGERTR